MRHSVRATSEAADQSETASERVVRAVAAEAGVDPVDLDTPLFEAVDPDALDDLFAGPGDEGRLVVSYCDYRVTVWADGAVDVAE